MCHAVSNELVSDRNLGSLLQQIGEIARKWGEVMAVAYQARWGRPPRRIDHEPTWSQQAFDASWGKIQQEIGIARIFEGSQSLNYWTLYRTASREFDMAFMPGPKNADNRRKHNVKMKTVEKKDEKSECNSETSNASGT